MKRSLIAGFALIFVLAMGFLTTQKLACHYSKEMCAATEKTTKTRVQINKVEHALEKFKKVCGHLPATNEGLRALMESPADCQAWSPDKYLAKNSFDPWGQFLIYERISQDLFTLTSYGADARPGGEGINKDISNAED